MILDAKKNLSLKTLQDLMEYLPSFLICDCCYVLAKPLAVLFSKSILILRFPKTWKTSRIVPVYKNNDRGWIINCFTEQLCKSF